MRALPVARSLPAPATRLAGLLAAVACAACSSSLALHAPDVVGAVARDATRVDLDPMESRGPVLGSYDPPGPASVLTAAMAQELAGRALAGGEPGGYVVHCALDRFAVRSSTVLTENSQLLTLYADASCEAKRHADGAPVWRGELRGRACAQGNNVLGTSIGVTQRLVDRALSDAAREMASDLAVRALGLRAAPSARAFADEGEQRARGGLDDTAWGPSALQEAPGGANHALRTLDLHDTTLRASEWNVVALASGPDDPWAAGEKMALDDEALVRFQQYKALARHGSPESLAQLRTAAETEGTALLAEMARDALASAGIGVARAVRSR
jgi:hypothetical protein